MSKTGFKNPPIEHRWKKGQSGNPSGRPKKETTFKQDIADVLFKPVYVLDANGRKKRTPLYEVALINFCKKILAGSAAEFCRGFRTIETILTRAEEQQLADSVRDPVVEKELAALGLKIEDGSVVVDEDAPDSSEPYT